jgi:hypothetical protein
MNKNNFTQVGIAALLIIGLAVYRNSRHNDYDVTPFMNQKSEESSTVHYYIDTAKTGTYQELLLLSKQDPQRAAKNSADAVLGDSLSRIVQLAIDERSTYSLANLNEIENSVDEVLSNLHASDSLTGLAVKLIKRNYESKLLEKIRIKRSVNS